MASDKVSVGEDNHDGLVPSPLHLPSVAARTTRNIKVKGISHRAMRNVVKFLNKGAIGFDEDEAEKVDEFVEAAIALKLRGVSRKEQVRKHLQTELYRCENAAQIRLYELHDLQSRNVWLSLALNLTGTVRS